MLFLELGDFFFRLWGRWYADSGINNADLCLAHPRFDSQRLCGRAVDYDLIKLFESWSPYSAIQNMIDGDIETMQIDSRAGPKQLAE